MKYEIARSRCVDPPASVQASSFVPVDVARGEGDVLGDIVDATATIISNILVDVAQGEGDVTIPFVDEDPAALSTVSSILIYVTRCKGDSSIIDAEATALCV